MDNFTFSNNIINNSISTMTSDGVIVSDRKVYVNGKEYDIPKHIKGRSTSVIDGKIYIDGYEFKNGEWKRTLASIWYWLF